MVSQTEYFRSDLANVNGLNTEKLRTTQSGVLYSWVLNDVLPTVYWGIRVWRRTSIGGETEITAGTPVAQVSRTVSGTGLQSNTWLCPQTYLSQNRLDSTVVRLYYKQGAGAWTLLDTWQTEQLNVTILNGSLWTVYLWTELNYLPVPEVWEMRFYADTVAYLSRIQNFYIGHIPQMKNKLLMSSGL